jgi:hypothetical protein
MNNASNPFLIKLADNLTVELVLNAFKQNSNIIRVINPSEELIIECSFISILFFQRCITFKNLSESTIIVILKKRPHYITCIEKVTAAMQDAIIYKDVINIDFIRSTIINDDTAFYIINNYGFDSLNQAQKMYIKKDIKVAYNIALQITAGNFDIIEKKYVSYVARFLNCSENDLFIYIPY